METDNIVGFLVKISETGSVGGLFDAFGDFLNDEGVGHYVVLRIPVASETSIFRIVHHRLPENWVDFYMSRGYHLIDPVLRHMAVSQGFYRFSEAYVAFQKDTERRGIERLAADRERFGVKDGYLFPVYGRFGLTGAVTLSGCRHPFSNVSLHLVNAALNQMFWRIVSLSGDGVGDLPRPDRQVAITRREKDVLARLAEGLTSNEIARELKLSSHTVDWYVNGLQGKLEARNRQHAIALAFRRGLLA